MSKTIQINSYENDTMTILVGERLIKIDTSCYPAIDVRFYNEKGNSVFNDTWKDKKVGD